MTTSIPLLLLIGASARAGTTINSTNRHASGANLGWQDWRGDTNNGAVIGEYVCSGYIYSANAGWIHLGSNATVNGISYQNNSAADYGVNHDGLGNLRGYAYGANIGWINFETNGAPKVDFKTGKLSGYAYGANCGWISLSNGFAFVKTDTIAPGAVGANGLPVAWMLAWTVPAQLAPSYSMAIGAVGLLAYAAIYGRALALPFPQILKPAGR